jgi:ACS family tartrate transporter-like MFS transporter
MFYVANPLAVFVMGFISKPLLAMDGIAGLRGWQWMFLIEGIPPVLIGLAILAFLPDRPSEVSWLTEPERESLKHAVADHPVKHEDHSASRMLHILADKRVLLLTLIYLLTLAAGTTFILSAPAILMERTGWDLGTVGWLISAGGLTAAAFMLIGGWITDHRGERYTVLFVALGFDILGYLMIVAAQSPWLIAAGLILSQVGRGAHSTAQVALWADVLKDRRMAIGAAAISSVANIGVWLLPIGFGMAKDATGGYVAGLWALPVMHVLALGGAVALWRSGKRT